MLDYIETEPITPTSENEYNITDDSFGDYSDHDIYDPEDLHDLEIGIEYLPSDNPIIRATHDWHFKQTSSDSSYHPNISSRHKKYRRSTPHKVNKNLYHLAYNRGMQSNSEYDY